MPFLDEDVMVRRLHAERWVLVRSDVYRGNVDTVTVPEGYVTDFASEPRVAVWLILDPPSILGVARG